VLEITAERASLPITSIPDNQYGWGLVRPDRAINYVAPPRFVSRGILVGNPLKAAQLARAGINASELRVVGSDAVNMYFENVPGSFTLPQPCQRYRLQGTARFALPYTALPDVWVRGSGSTGASDSVLYDPHIQVPWGRVLSRTDSTATFETFVYYVPNHGWIPADTSAAAVAWSVVAAVGVTAVDERSGPGMLRLQARANPVRGSATLELDIPTSGMVDVAIHDLSGRVIARLVNRVLEPGNHHIKWDGHGLGGNPCPAGVYFVHAAQQGRAVTQKLVLLHGGGQ
jgi:hypothetical protein